LILFWVRSQQQPEWRNINVVNITNITHQKVASPVTSWQTRVGTINVEHLAGLSSTGRLLEFYWSPQHYWQVITTAQVFASPVTSWLAKSVPNGPFNLEHLAGKAPNGDLLVLFRIQPQLNWQVVNLSDKTGQKVSTQLTS
jgi:hypothetical protein